MEWDLYLRALVALVAVLGLITGAAWAARRFGLAGAQLGSRRKRRLSIVETMAIDGRRRLVLIRRDDAEHLLLIGGGSDIIVEGGITVPTPAAVETPQKEDADR